MIYVLGAEQFYKESEQKKEQTSLHIDMYTMYFGTSIFLIPLTTDVFDLLIH